MKPSDEAVLKAFRGLAIAASRARELVAAHGKSQLLDKMPRRQQDAVRQHLLEIARDVETVVKTMTTKP